MPTLVAINPVVLEKMNMCLGYQTLKIIDTEPSLIMSKQAIYNTSDLIKLRQVN